MGLLRTFRVGIDSDIGYNVGLIADPEKPLNRSGAVVLLGLAFFPGPREPNAAARLDDSSILACELGYVGVSFLLHDFVPFNGL